MSFILDALKKSDSERQGQNAPGIADIPYAIRRAPQPFWIWALSALLVVNIVVLVVVLLRPDATPVLPVAVQKSTVVLPGDGAAKPVAAANMTGAREARRPEPVAAVQPDRPPPVRPAGSDQQTVEPRPAVSSAKRNPPPPTVRDGLKTLNELRAAGLLQLGELHLDIHVYSEKSKDRFVFVNMTKYKEHARLDEGPIVKEITPDGVVLEHAGLTFLLPRE